MRSQSGTICNPYQGRKSNRSSLLLIDLHSFKTKQKTKQYHQFAMAPFLHIIFYISEKYSCTNKLRANDEHRI